MNPGQLSITPDGLNGFQARPDHHCIDYTLNSVTVTYCLKPLAWQALAECDKAMVSVVFSGMAIRHGMLISRKSRSVPKIPKPPFCEWVEYLQQ